MSLIHELTIDLRYADVHHLEEASSALAAAIRSEQDYTRAVISERDALKAELEVAKADAYHCREALWRACGDDEEHVNAYLEAVKP